MNKTVLFVAINIALCVNVFGQIHKAMGDKPLFSREYSFTINSDSTLDSKEIYTYNINQQLCKTIGLNFEDEEFYVDSTLTSYDDNNRIISSDNYEDGEIVYSERWIYDTSNQEINYYSFDINGDSLSHGFYKGVNNFDNIPKPISSLLPFGGNDFLETIMDCDTIFYYQYDNTTSSWNSMAEIYPIYQNGKPVSYKMVVENFDASDFGMPADMDMNMVLDITCTYSGDKLMQIDGTMEMEISGIWMTISVPIVQINQYNENDLLIESKIEANISIPMGGTIFVGVKQKYIYNLENNLSVLIQEGSGDGNLWDVATKTYYFYHEDNADDIALIRIESPSASTIDIPNEFIDITIALENKNYLDVYQNVSITALIRDSQDNQIETFTETINQIYLGTSMLYTFLLNYMVPDDSTYSITVYIDSKDGNTLNDTLYQKRYTKPLNDVKTINNVKTYMSQNIPNPADDHTLITYGIPKDGQVTFSVYNINGQLLSSQSVNAKSGENTLELDTDNLSSGLYLYAMEFNGLRIMKKMNVLK